MAGDAVSGLYPAMTLLLDSYRLQRLAPRLIQVTSPTNCQQVRCPSIIENQMTHKLEVSSDITEALQYGCRKTNDNTKTMTIPYRSVNLLCMHGIIWLVAGETYGLHSTSQASGFATRKFCI